MIERATQFTTIEELRRAGVVAFGASSEPTFKYGLNVFFSGKEVGLPFGDVTSSASAIVRAPQGVEVLSLADALAKPSVAAFVMGRLNADDVRVEKVGAWHRSQAGVGAVVVVPSNFSSEEPIRVDLELADKHRVENLIVIVGEGSRVSVVEHLRSGSHDAPALRSSLTDVVVQANAHATFISLQDFSEGVTDFSLKRGTVLRDGSLSWIECVFGGAFSQSLTHTELTEEGAATSSKTMFFGRHAQKFDLSQRVRHSASRTHSDLRTRGALMDTAKTIYRGLVRVEKGTKGCVGHQKEDTLLLAERAEIDAVPNLEIETDDVRCGHSASVGRVDKDKLFYLISRGLDEATARRFLVEGFFAGIVHDMAEAGLQDRVQCIIDERIEAVK